MSTVQRVNFEPVRDALSIQRAHYKLSDPTILDPYNAVALVDGEWMSLTADGKAIERAADVATDDEEAGAALCYPVWHERGRSDGLALGNRGVPVFWLGAWEADTRIYDATATPGSGAAITAIDQGVKVATITIGTRNYVGLVGHGGSGDSSRVVGFVTKLPNDNGGKLRIRGGSFY